MKKLCFILAVVVLFVIGSSCNPDPGTTTPPDKPDVASLVKTCDSLRLEWLSKMADFVPIIYYEVSPSGPNLLNGSFVVNYPTSPPNGNVYWGVKSDTARVLKVGVSQDTLDLKTQGYMNLQPLRVTPTTTDLYSQRVTWTIPAGPINTISVEVRKDGNPKGKGTLIADRDNSKLIESAPTANTAANQPGGI